MSQLSNELATLAQKTHFSTVYSSLPKIQVNESNDMRLIRLVWIQRKKLS